MASIQPRENKRSEFMTVRKKSSFSGPVVFFLVIIGIIFVLSVFMRVSDITVNGNSHYSDIEIIQAVDIEEGDNLFFFDRFAAVSRAFAKLPYIEEISIERYLPNKVIVNVKESRALGYLVLGDEYWTLDHNCKVLGKASEDELSSLIPVLGIEPGTLLIGEAMHTADGKDEIVPFVAEVMYQIQERGIFPYVSGVDFADPKAVQFTYDNRFTVIIGGSDNVEYKFGMLMSALSRLKSGDQGIVDLSDGATVHFMPY